MIIHAKTLFVIQPLHYELSVLSRAIAYQNLSGASAHVGLSQPQLSRIIARLEEALDVTLLDRTSRRKSSWTPLARHIAETFLKSSQKLDKELDSLIKASEPTSLTVGTLEGLIPIASRYCHHLLKHTGLQTLELQVHDLNRLEELFLNGDFSFIFSSREPGRKKFKHEKRLGFQSLELKGAPSETRVLSSFEYLTTLGGARRSQTPSPQKILVSNSLEVRKHWISHFGGTGRIPSEIYVQKPASEAQPVLLIAVDSLSEKFWTQIKKCIC